MFAEFVTQANRLETAQRRTLLIVLLIAVLHLVEIGALVYLVAR